MSPGGFLFLVSFVFFFIWPFAYSAFFFFNVLLYIKRAELKKAQVRETREFCVTEFLFWYIKHRDLSPRYCQIVLQFYSYFLSYESKSVKNRTVSSGLYGYQQLIYVIDNQI